MSTTVVSNKQFWLSTLSLILIWIVVLTSADLPSSNDFAISAKSKEKYGKENHINERNCKALCKHCGCMGFYCGEECICECNNEKSDTECISTMQSNARKLDIPFQLLIQGPSSNYFVRNARHYSHDGSIALMPHRNRRSTVVIYKPAIQNSLVLPENEAQKFGIHKEKGALRDKRSVGNHLEWFNDFANTLVRPAPLGGVKKTKQAIEPSAAPQKRATKKNEMDQSWFTENTSLLLRPAPLFKRQRSSSKDETDVDNGLVDKHVSAAVEKLPKVLKDTLRSIQGTTMGGDAAGDIGETLRTHFKEGANVLQSQLTDNNLEFLPTNGVLSDNIQQTLSNLHSQIFPTKNDDEKIVKRAEAPRQKRVMGSKLASRPKFTWFRPIRFLQRVQEAIN